MKSGRLTKVVRSMGLAKAKKQKKSNDTIQVSH